MNRKKAKLLIIGICAVALVTWVVLMVTIFRDRGEEKKPGRKPTPTIPAEIPEGSILVWRQTATYIQNEGESEVLSEERKFDEYGRCVECINYYFDGEVQYRKKYEYVEGDRRTIEIERNYDAAGEESCVTTTEFDAEGRIVRKREEHRYSGLGTSTTVCSYDENGTLRTLENDNKSDTEDKSYRYTFDFYGHPENYMVWGSDGIWHYFGGSEHDAQGRVISYDEWDEEGNSVQRDRYEFLPDGGYIWKSEDSYTVRIMRFDADGLVQSDERYYPEGERENDYTGFFYEYVKDENGGITVNTTRSLKEGAPATLRSWEKYTRDMLMSESGVVLDDGTIVVTREYEYDNLGRRVKYSIGSVQIIEYKYDEYGNCVAQELSFPSSGEQGQVISYVYSPMVITKEQKALAEEYYLPGLAEDYYHTDSGYFSYAHSEEAYRDYKPQ